MSVKYILAFGARRLTAARKLGWSTIDAILQETGELVKAPVDDIEILDNTRIRDFQKDEDFSTFMNTLKRDGQLQPIGIWRDTEKIRKDYSLFAVKNLIENIHDKPMSPFEISHTVLNLKKLGHNNAEIAVLLSIPKTRVETLLRISSKFKEEHLADVKQFNEKRDTGKLSVTTLNEISGLRIPQKEIDSFIDYVKKNELKLNDVRLIKKFLEVGFPLSKSLLLVEDYMIKETRVIVNKKELELRDFESGGFNEFVRKILSNSDPKLFMEQNEQTN